MARYGDLDSQYFDDAGDPLVSGKIYFYETGTTTPKTTYADVNYTIPNANPVILTAAGRQPNIFFPGVAKAILATSAGTQILVRDPVGETDSSFGNPWIASKDYNANSVVLGSDGQFYVSLVNSNTNHDPVSTSGYWTFLYSVDWSAGTTYKTGSVVTYQSLLYQSLQNANLNKNPLTEPTWWTQFVGLVLTTKGSIAVGNGTTTVTLPVGANGLVLGANSAAASGLAWVSPSSGSLLIRDARTSNTALDAADLGVLIDITSGTFTQTFDAAATLGDGWFCYIRNSGTGDITLDPNASETIDGLTSYVMYPGEVRLVQCDGTALRTIVINTFYRTFTASGTFTKPPGYVTFSGLLWGAGGSAGKGGAFGCASGGGGGACNPFNVPSSSFGTSETITIGAGGTAQSTDYTSGSAGGTSSIGSVVYSYGGGAGVGTNSFLSMSGGGGGGVLSVGANASSGIGTTLGGNPRSPDGNNNPGLGGGRGQANNAGGSTAWGGAAGGSSKDSGSGLGGDTSLYGAGGGAGTGNSGTTVNGGISIYGGSGGQSNRTATPAAPTAPGGGGGATNTGAASAAGARGELRIWGII